MPVVALLPSISPPAGGGGVCCVRAQFRKERGLANNAKMLQTLRRCGGGAAAWKWTLSCQHWKKLPIGGTTGKFEDIKARRSPGGFLNRGRPVAGKYEHLSYRARVGSLHESDSCCSCSTNVARTRARRREASTSGFDSGVGFRMIHSLSTTAEFYAFVGVDRKCNCFAVHSSSGCCQVSFGWNNGERKGGREYTSVHWNGEENSHESRHPKRFHGAVSHTNAAVETRISEAVVRKGALLEFERESGKILLAVAQNREGKKNWTAIDQNGNTHIVRPQQITYLVPNPDDFEPSDIGQFLGKVENMQDLGLLEFAWEEVLREKVAQVQAENLAKILYSQDTPLECYTVHRMLSGNQIFFRCKQKGLTPVYEPRPLPQVRELQQKRLADEKTRNQLLSYARAIKLALKCPQNDKPPESKWHEGPLFHMRTESLTAYALNPRLAPAQKKAAEEVIDVMGLTKNPAVVVNLLIGMGIFPCHVNVDLLRMKNLVEFTKEHTAAVEQLCEAHPVDPDLENRVDLTAMKVYTIDSDDTDEIDDGLSATRLADGRIKVWIHIADPTRWLPQDHVLTREAESRGTSIYLPTGTIPMFPMELAGGHMSLRQGHNCCAITVSVVLSDDGSIAEYSVMNSTICPTYKLSYDNVAELLLIHVEEEPELYLLAEAATCRAKWRTSQGAILTFIPEPEIKVKNPNSTEPSILLDLKDQSAPAMQLVAEMMILCGEAVSLIGEENRLCLPYRGQAQTNFPKRVQFNLPEGPCRAFAMRRFLGSADMSFIEPIPHASLGLSGYVQFSSPIRRFSDLISHYQVKAYMRGDVPPFSIGNVEAKMAMANLRTQDARKLQTSSVRYWTIEYLRRQPRDRQYPAVVLQSKKDGEVAVLLLEVGFRSGLSLSSSPPVGSEVMVMVVCADPRKDVIHLRVC